MECKGLYLLESSFFNLYLLIYVQRKSAAQDGAQATFISSVFLFVLLRFQHLDCFFQHSLDGSAGGAVHAGEAVACVDGGGGLFVIGDFPHKGDAMLLAIGLNGLRMLRAGIVLVDAHACFCA